MGKYFGTDGFRGRAGEELTVVHAHKIGRFLGYFLKNQYKRKIKVVIGKDTRLSSYMLEYAIASGFASSGTDVYMMHVTTTPSVSYITSTENFDLGIMISASHNPYYDNGIKILNSNGEKIDEELIEKIENYIDYEENIPFEKDANIGKIIDYYEGRNRYIGYLISTCTHSFKGIRVGLDGANGGAHMIAKSVFSALGAKTYVINDIPNGININDNAGSTHTENLRALVKRNYLDIAFAFDGDADRVIAIDENGNEINGDYLIYILAKDLKKKGELRDGTIVTTIMSNYGLYKALEKEDIKYETVSVGDRFVQEKMKEKNYDLGGESSGHIIISKYAKTGDGILSAIKILEIVKEENSTLSKLCAPVKMLPQITKNIEVKNKEHALKSEDVQKAYNEVKKELEGSGRVILRASGTEPLLRVSVECENYEKCQRCVDKIVNSINSNKF